MNRWAILGLLVAARTVMAMQYQAVGALSPLIAERFTVGLAEIGVVIGLYMLPGLFFALPGASIGQRFGEKRVSVIACGLMGAGSLAMALTGDWTLFLLGHLLAGLGGVLINILMTKMAADWFVGAEITTAMAIFINSWPMGIALALVLFPPMATSFGVGSAFWLLSGFACLCGLLVAIFYRDPPGVGSANAPRIWPRGEVLSAVLAAGLCWGAFNGGLGILFGFGTPLLVAFGESPENAARMTSLILWVLAIAAPCGGYIADKTGRGREMVLFGLAGLICLSPLTLMSGITVPVFMVYGVVTGLVAGPIVSMPARVLPPEMRTVGMGLFFTTYYGIFIVSPALAGALADISGVLPLAFWCAAFLQLAALIGALWYGRIQQRI
ncbi:MAG: MFS transporter [Pseudomonadota bacterium]